MEVVELFTSKLANSCVSRRDTAKRIEAFLLKTASLAKNFNSDANFTFKIQKKKPDGTHQVFSIVEVLTISERDVGDERDMRHERLCIV